ncbi:MAG: aspartate/glutamate racemase family protein [Burkholderiales bacterium]|nr:aspartate/glutamate racemase family protein [Burkholderiales bacterium]
MKTIGLIGGMSWESSATYYRLINEGMKQRLGGHHNARSVMVTVSFEAIKALQHDARWDALGEQMAAAARQLQAGGADFVALCTNTMHQVADHIERAIDIPFLHIVDPTGEALQRAHIRKAALLGTRFTMEQDFYRSRMQMRYGIELLTPSAEDRTVVHDVIYEELCHGIVTQSSRAAYQRIIASLADQGAEAVILGCTEIMLLIGPDDVALPVFDTTGLHADAAVSWALRSC